MSQKGQLEPSARARANDADVPEAAIRYARLYGKDAP